MSKYRIDITTSAQRQFKKLSKALRNRILPKLYSLETHPRPFGCQKLYNSDFYRIRLGDYQIIYSIDDGGKRIRILDIGHRRDVYK